MAWIESHQELGQHPKTKRFARILKISLPSAVGHLHFLWWWALDYAEDGDLYAYDAFDIEDAAMWEGDPEEFVQALLKCGYIEQAGDRYRLADWQGGRVHPSELEANRNAWNQMRAKVGDKVFERDGRVCATCGATDDLQIDHVLPLSRGGSNGLRNLQVLCGTCNRRKGGSLEWRG